MPTKCSDGEDTSETTELKITKNEKTTQKCINNLLTLIFVCLQTISRLLR